MTKRKMDIAMKTISKENREKPKEFYLKIPYHILNITEIGLPEKVLLAHFYSFGKKGCWQSNATLAKMFMTTPRTIQRWLANIESAKLIYIKSPKGFYRTIWVKSHHDVAESVKLHYRNQQIPKPENELTRSPNHDKSVVVTATNLASDCDKSCIEVRQNCPTTNNNTIKETTVKISATPAPLPAGGQAPALLAQRKTQLAAQVADLYTKLGRRRSTWRPPTPEEFQRMKRETLEQFRAIQEAKAR